MSIGPFKVGDNPAYGIQLDLESYSDTTAYTHAEGRLIDPSGTVVANLGPAPIVGEEQVIAFSFPSNPFATAGLYRLSVTLTGGVFRKHLDSITVIVEGDDGWHTLASARQSWPSSISDELLAELLDIAREQVVAYAPGNPASGTALLRAAQVMQARNVHNASKADPEADESGFVIQPRPLDWIVKQLIRPRKAVGSVR